MATQKVGEGTPLAQGAEAQAETWRPVPGVPGYEVSDLGRVRSWRAQGRRAHDPAARATAPRLLGGTRQRYGHVCYSLRAGGQTVYRFGHAMVLEAFVGPRPEGLEVCHLDGDASNNELANLRYGTRLENQHDRSFHEHHGRKVRHGAPVFIGDGEQRRLAALRDQITTRDPDGAALLDGILARIGTRYGRRSSQRA